MDYRNPNSESIPRKIIAKKKQPTHKLGNGKIAKAFGNILKLSSGPDKCKSLIPIPILSAKWPKYMKTFTAHNIPHTIILTGTITIELRNCYLRGFMLERLIIPDIAIVIWKNT